MRYRTGGGPAGPEEYAAGHIPGAAYVDLDTDLADPPGAGRAAPAARHRRSSRRRCGGPASAATRPVVVYDDWQALAAGRCWWLLRYHGHPDVRVLDGGWSAWLADGGAVETGAADPGTRRLHRRARVAMPVVEADRVPDVAVLVDARAPERYRGETEPIDPVAGRIPGAVNVPTDRNLDRRRPVPAGRRAARALRRGRAPSPAPTWRRTAAPG